MNNIFLPQAVPASPGQLQVATFQGWVSGKGCTLILEGQTTPTTKYYKRLSSAALTSGDRVLIAEVSGTFVILGKIII